MGGAMSKITTPLQALEEIRAVCWSEARRENVTSATFEMLRRQVAELAMDGMRSAAEPAGLTPVQAHADELLEWAQKLKRCGDKHSGIGYEEYLSMGEYDKLRALLDELDPPKPPKPPTLEEAIDALAPFSTDRLSTEEYGQAVLAARRLLARVPN